MKVGDKVYQVFDCEVYEYIVDYVPNTDQLRVVDSSDMEVYWGNKEDYYTTPSEALKSSIKLVEKDIQKHSEELYKLRTELAKLTKQL